jgi:hypothetical protein
MATKKRLAIVDAFVIPVLVAGCTTSRRSVAASGSLRIQSIRWSDVSVPGAVCHAAHPIHLRNDRAVIGSPPQLAARSSRLVVQESGVVYGDLNGNGEDAAGVLVSCSTTAGTADGQLADSLVIFTADGGSLRVVGTLAPRQPANPGLPHGPYFDDGSGALRIDPGSMTVHEVWYGPNDATCCPTMRATTVWAFAHGSLTAVSTTPTGQ